MSFSRGLKAKAEKVWEDGYHHPFVQGLGKGDLDEEAFKFWLLQDYLYLINYAKVFSAAAVKADSEDLMRKFSSIQYFTLEKELDLHRSYMKEFGLDPEIELPKLKSSLFNSAYTSNMLVQAQTGGIAEILAAVFPCAWTYSDYGKRLKADFADNLEGNFYRSWIEKYASDEFAHSFEWFYDKLDELVQGMTEKQKEKITDIFISSVEFEYLFWEMCYKQLMSYE